MRNKYLQKILCLLYNIMSSQEEHNKLTDEEKFKLIGFYKENSELWVTHTGDIKKPKSTEKRRTSGGV